MHHPVLPFLAASPHVLSKRQALVAWVLTQAERQDEQERRYAEPLADHKYNDSSGNMSSPRLQENNL